MAEIIWTESALQDLNDIAEYIAIPASIFVVNAGWYMVVALLLSSETPRKNYLRFKGVFDSTAGTVMAFLGLKLLISSSK